MQQISFLCFDETRTELKQYFDAAINPKCDFPAYIEIEDVPPIALSSLAEDIHDKLWEVSQNTDLDMQGFLMIDEALQSKVSEHVNTSKLTETDKLMKKDNKMVKEITQETFQCRFNVAFRLI